MKALLDNTDDCTHLGTSPVSYFNTYLIKKLPLLVVTRAAEPLSKSVITQIRSIFPFQGLQNGTITSGFVLDYCAIFFSQVSNAAKIPGNLHLEHLTIMRNCA